MARESREVWAKRVEQWLESGETAKEFAAANCINVWTLRKWREKLARESRSSSNREALPRSTRPSKGRAGGANGALAFVEVLAGSGIHSEPERFEIVLAGGSTVRVPVRFDPDMLQRLLAVLERC